MTARQKSGYAKQKAACLEQARAGNWVRDGHLYTGASHRCYFWNGYHHHPVVGGLDRTLRCASYMAGKQFRKETDEFVGLTSTAGMPYKDMKA